MYYFIFMKIAMWNVREVGASHKSMAVAKLIKEGDLDFIGLVEAKHATIDERRIKSWWNGDEVVWHDVAAMDGRGRLVCCWKESSFISSEISKGVRWIYIQGKDKVSGFAYAVVVVYGWNS